jgi:hypothetical protein
VDEPIEKVARVGCHRALVRACIEDMFRRVRGAFRKQPLGLRGFVESALSPGRG